MAEDIKFTLEMIRLNLGKSRQEMADLLEVSLDRYNRLVAGDSRMLAIELIKLMDISNLKAENIKILS